MKQLQFVTQIRQHKIRALKTLAVCLAYLSIGLQTSSSVALLDLQVLAGCTFQQITLIITSGSIGYATGSVLAGFMEAKFNPQAAIAFNLLIDAIVYFSFPFCRSLYIMLVLYGIGAISNGFLDCFSNIFILKLWGKECPPFLQALHFCYGFGSIITPLVAAPLLKEDGTEHDSTSGITNSTKKVLTPDDIDLFVPYSFIGVCTSLAAAYMFTLYIMFRETTDHPSRNTPVYESKNGEQVEVKKVVNPRVRLIVILLIAFFLVLYAGMEQTIGHLVPAFAHDGPLHLSKQVGAQISAVFWVTFTTFRFVAVIGSGILGTLTILIFNIITTIISSITMVVGQKSESAFWFSCAFMGVGLSSTWGSVFAFSESQFPVHGKIVATFTVGAALGSAVTPAVIGYLMGIENAVFAWFPLIFSILTAIIFALIFIICKTCLYKKDGDESSGHQDSPDTLGNDIIVLKVPSKEIESAVS